MYASKTALARLSILAFGVVALGCGKDSPNATKPKSVATNQQQTAVIQMPPRPQLPERKAALEDARRAWLDGPLRDKGFPFGMEHVWDRGYGSSNPFLFAMRRTGGSARIPIAHGEHYPKWVKVRLNNDGVGFDEIAFFAESDDPLDLIWAFAVPGNPRMNWDIIGGANDPKCRFAEYHQRSNLKLADLDLPAHNTVIFQQLNGGQLTSDVYRIWFAFDDPDPVDIYVKIRLYNARQESQPDSTTAEQIAERLGLEVPLRQNETEPSDGPSVAAASGDMPVDMAEKLYYAWLLQRYQRSRTVDFARILASVRSGFSEVPIAVEEEVPKWVKVRMNSLGSQLDAFRFVNPCDYSADLIWAFALPKTWPGQATWYIASESGLQSGFTDYWPRNCLQVPDLDLPDHNLVVFQQLDGGQIAPGQECYLWFALDTPMTTDVYVKLLLAKPDPNKYPHFTNARPIAERLGFEMPLRFNEAASLQDRAGAVAETQGIEAGLEFLTNANTREGDFSYATWAHQYAIRFAEENGDRVKANTYFAKAADSMREFRQKHAPLAPEETEFLKMVLYNEACSLALDGQPEKAVEPLRQAIQAGFNDLAHMLQDEDLQSVRELPAFQDLIGELDEQAQPSVP